MSFGSRHPAASERLDDAGPRTHNHKESSDGAEVNIIERLQVDEVGDRTGLELAQAEAALVEAITNSVLQGIQQADIGERHAEVIDAITNITVEPADLTPILNAIARLSSVRESHQEVLEGLHRDFSLLLQELRQDLADLRQEVLENRRDTRSDAEVLLGELRALPQAMADIRQCLRKLEQKADHSEVLQAMRKIRVEQDSVGIANAMSEMRIKVDHSEVLQALKRLEPDHHVMASVMADKLRKVSLSMDTGELLAAIKRIRVDHQEIANSVHDRISRGSGLIVDQTEVLKELRKLKRETDLTQVLAAVQQMEAELSNVLSAVSNMRFEVDHAPVISEIRKIKVPNHEEIATQVQSRIRSHTVNVDNSEVLSAIKKLNVEPDLSPIIDAINSAEVDFAPIHEAIAQIRLTVDHGPVLEAVRRINIPDHQEIAASVHERLRRTGAVSDNAEVLRELKKLRSDKIDLSPVLQAINAAEIDLSPIHEAIGKISLKVDHGEVLQAIRKIQIPDHNVIAHAVHERFRRNSSLDHGELIKEIRKSRVEPDLSPVLSAINQAEVDVAPVIEEIKKLNVTVDNTQVLQALSNLRVELLAAVSQPRELLQPSAPPVVQAMMPVQTMVQSATPLQQIVPVHVQQHVVAESVSPIVQTWRRRDVTPPPYGPLRQVAASSSSTGPGTLSAQSSSSVLAPPVMVGTSDVVVEGFEAVNSPRHRTPTSSARERRGVLPRGLLGGT